jgi:transcriptional regulator with XRE-family HTH domain
MAEHRRLGYNHWVSTARTTEANRFGDELRRWRAVRRVSQLELAVRSGTTQRHLSFMERGRSRPGREIVVRLAESLRLSPRERNALLHHAGYAPVFPETSLDAPMLRPVREALDSILYGHMPYPALVLGPYGEVVSANAAIDVLTEGAGTALLEPPVNMLRLMLHPDGMAGRAANLADWGRHVVENLRARALRSPDRRLGQLVDELAGYLPAARPGPDHLGFSVPLRLCSEAGELRLITR